jgi:hypothetical protein
MVLDPDALEFLARRDAELDRLRRRMQRIEDAVADDAYPPQPRNYPSAKGGRPRSVDQVMRAMRDDLAAGRLTREQLDRLSGKAMVSRYGPSRNTCTRARQQVRDVPKTAQNVLGK